MRTFYHYRTALLILTAVLTACQPISSTPEQQLFQASDGTYAAEISGDGRYSLVSSINHGVTLWDNKKNAQKFRWRHSIESGENLFGDTSGLNTDALTENLIFAVATSNNDSHSLLADEYRFSLWNNNSGQNIGYWQIAQSTVEYRQPNWQHRKQTSTSTLFDIVRPNVCQSDTLLENQGCEFTNKIRDIAVSNNGKHVVIGKSDGVVTHINLTTGRRLNFLGHLHHLADEQGNQQYINNAINNVDISGNGRFVLTGSSDQMAYLWDTNSGQVVYRFRHPNRVVLVELDDSGRYALTADSQKQTIIWDLSTGKEVSRLKYVNRQEVFSSAQFSHNGQYLVTGAPTRQLTLWNVQTGQQVEQWLVTAKPNRRPASAIIHSVAFSEDDNFIYSASSAGFTEVWKVSQ